MMEKLGAMVSLQIALAGLIAGADPSHVGLIGMYQEFLGWTDIIKANNEQRVEEAYIQGALDYCRRESLLRADIDVPEEFTAEEKER